MPDPNPKRVDLALQGGGSHGAFTWGVLDRLLEEESIEIEAVSGTSAGAMNACAVVEGLARGGRDTAREKLRSYWLAVSKASRFSPIQRTAMDKLLGRWSLANSPTFIWSKTFFRSFSPYAFNPFGVNPLRSVVANAFDFDAINGCEIPRLFLCATNVRTGRPKIFRQPEISVDAVLASACLPFMSHAVEIDGEAYWDGGFMGNPPLFPLIDETDARDLLRSKASSSAHSDEARVRSLKAAEEGGLMGRYLLKSLKAAIVDHPYVGDVRGKGLMVGVEFIADKRIKRLFPAAAMPHKKVSAAIAAEGLLALALPFLDVVSLSPPLRVTEGDVNEIVKRFVAGLVATEDLKQCA